MNYNVFLCDDSDCDMSMGIVYGNVVDANGDDFETGFTAGTTYYIWTNIGDAPGHIADTPLTVFDADGATVLLAQNDDGPVNSYIEFIPAAESGSRNLARHVYGGYISKAIYVDDLQEEDKKNTCCERDCERDVSELFSAINGDQDVSLTKTEATCKLSCVLSGCVKQMFCTVVLGSVSDRLLVFRGH